MDVRVHVRLGCGIPDRKKCDYAVSAEWPILLNSSLDKNLATPRHGMNDRYAAWNM